MTGNQGDTGVTPGTVYLFKKQTHCRHMRGISLVPDYTSTLHSLMCHAVLDGITQLAGSYPTFPASKENIMSKEQKSNREGKKKALLTPKEKKAAKKLKKDKSGIVANEIKF